MMITKILIGIDDSKYAEHAAAYGFDIARKFNAAVGVVNIIEPVLPMDNASADPMIGISAVGADVADPELMTIRNDHSKSIVDQAIRLFGDEITVTRFAEYGPTADGIISCSKDFSADLIIIGTHSRTGLDRLLMGSVAEDVVRHSTVPVLVVPFKDEA